MKLVNNLLASIHLAVAAEGLAFAKYKGMDLTKVFEVVSRGAASSYMLHDRESHNDLQNTPPPDD